MHEISLALIIPTYNRCELIAETIDSALNQSQPFEEIIVVDDGSTDNTAEKLLSRYDSKIRIIQIRNSGVQNARNVAAAATQCSHITFCDSDDLLEPRFAETMKERLNQSDNSQLIYSNFISFSGTQTSKDKFSQAPGTFFEGSRQDSTFITGIPDLYARTMIFQPLFLSGLTIEKSYFDQIGGFNTNFKNIGSEDWEFTLRAISHTPAILCKLPLVKVRRHDSNDSGNNTRQSLGEAQIIEYALNNHEQAAPYKLLLLKEMNKRRLDAFNGAYASGDFITAARTAKLIKHHPAALKHYTKLFIINLPSSIRQLAWKATQ